jgi:hypothetical protein
MRCRVSAPAERGGAEDRAKLDRPFEARGPANGCGVILIEHLEHLQIDLLDLIAGPTGPAVQGGSGGVPQCRERPVPTHATVRICMPLPI